MIEVAIALLVFGVLTGVVIGLERWRIRRGLEWHGFGSGSYLWFQSEGGPDLIRQLLFALVLLVLAIGVAAVVFLRSW